MPWRSSRRTCSATALQIERSPECSRATSWPGRVRRDILRLDLVERQRRGVDQPRVRRAVREQLRRHDRAGVEADRAARQQVAAAQGDQVGRARAGADEMHGHRRALRDRDGAGDPAEHQPRPEQARRRRRRPPAPPPRTPRRVPVAASEAGGAGREPRRRRRPARRPAAAGRAGAAASASAGSPRLRRHRRQRIERATPRARRAASIAASTSAAVDAAAAAEPGDRHGFTQAHCVTGIAGRQPVMPPTGAARATAMRGQRRRRAGPRRASSSACISSVTALATSRPPGRSAAIGGVEHARIAAAAAEEDRVRRRQPGERRRRRALDDAQLRHAERRGVAADARGAVGPRLDGDGARATDAAASTRSPPSPAPAPMSHSSSPRRGASADRVTRAHLALGDLAVVLEAASSGRPAAERQDARPARPRPRCATRFSAAQTASPKLVGAPLAAAARRGPPSASSTCSRDAPNPSATSSRAIAAGASPSEVSARMRVPGCSSGRISSIGRPCSEIVSTSGSGQPSRAAARLKAEAAGITAISAGSTWRARRGADAVLERIARGEHADRAAAQRHAPRPSPASNGLGQARASPRISGAASARCRRPPNTTSAAGDVRGARPRRARRRRPRRCRRPPATLRFDDRRRAGR